MRKIKKIYLALAILEPLLAAELCRAQSSFIFANWYGGAVDAPVFDADGSPLFGTNYLAMLYGGSTIDSLATATIQNSSTHVMPPAPFTLPLSPFGYFNYDQGWVVIPSVPGSHYAWLQVRAWDARLGATYEEVVALGIGGYGESSIFQDLGGDPYAITPIPPQPLYGLQSFSLLPVIPEPSAWALFTLGGVSMWFMARRKH